MREAFLVLLARPQRFWLEKRPIGAKIVYTLVGMAEMTPEVEEEVRRYAGLLRQAIRAAGLSVSEVERRLGAGPKALRRIFSGQVDLKLKHIVAILRIIGMSQEEFFAIASRPKQTPHPQPPHAHTATDLPAR